MNVRELKEMLAELDPICDDYQVVVGKAGVAEVDGEINAYREDLPITLTMITRSEAESEKEVWLGSVEEEQRDKMLEIVATWELVDTFKTRGVQRSEDYVGRAADSRF